ncbi:MAG: hypothetical protein DPW18_07055 [Chloroflexi bacterium]|nr:hypothetical protein [Chloroflexota bacterium]MDL1942317.1 hypothetical protein [Chloroflexi bacterium CFX2]
MITSFTYQTNLQQMKVTPVTDPNGLSRVFAAAVVNRQFCDMLLKNPLEALQNGYLGETFTLTKEEKDLIASIRAESLPDLARQVYQSLSSQYQ